MEEIKLRPYQKEGIVKARNAIKEGEKRIVFCSSTGSGKTFTFSFIVKSALSRGKRILILTHRIELMTQAGGSLFALNLKTTNIEAGKMIKAFTGNLYTAMIETINRRMDMPEYQGFLNSLDMVIIDECHIGSFDKFMAHIPKECVVIGFTATPHREGKQKPLSGMYQKLIEIISIPELVKQGYLSKPKSYGVKTDMTGIGMKGGDYNSDQMGEKFTSTRLWEGVIENYKRICPDQKALVFCPSVKSSLVMRDKMIEAGIECMHLDGTTPKAERVKILNWFKLVPNAVLCNVGVLTTGFDEPTIRTIILYRATKSLPLFLQMVGRGSRVIPDKKDCFTILDFGNNIREHGFWEDEREWSLLKKEKKKKKGASPVKECKACGALIHTNVRICPYCGTEIEVKAHKKKGEVAFLEDMTPQEARRMAKDLTLEEKAKMAKAKKIKAAWVLHSLTSREDGIKFIGLMGYKRGWLRYNEDRFECFKK